MEKIIIIIFYVFFGVNEDCENWSWEKKGSNLDDWEKLNNGKDVFVERTDLRREMKRRHRKNNSGDGTW